MTDYAMCDALLRPQEHRNLPDLLHANVEFGVLESDGSCVNVGICRINATHHRNMSVTSVKKRQCPLAEAFLSVTPHGRLQMFFPRAGMKPCTERVFFRHPVFPVPVAYFLPEPIRESLPGLLEPIIDAGLYPIRHSRDGFVVVF
ncbi:MAG: hypothetical protein EP344_02645 [Bacteroidetes bacterium]|nr:MAG: hypothetical protein EP344_02645 [Bacteroidota bacterium]